MIYTDTTAIEATNNGRDIPMKFAHKRDIIATSKWVNSDGWRGYTEFTPGDGFKEIEASWVTGDWDDAPAGHSESEVEAKLKALDKKYGDVWIIFAPTSNVFSTSYITLVRETK